MSDLTILSRNRGATAFEMCRRSIIPAIFGLMLAVYILVYVLLSCNGRYEPIAIGLNGVKCHSWAPRGFYADLTWRRTPLMFFAPLYWADRWLWHTDDKAKSGLYPVTEVDPNDIWKYYEAAGFFEQPKGESGSASATSEP